MMKKTRIYQFLVLLSGLALLASCEKEAREPVVGVYGPPQITAPADGSSYVLTDSTAGDVMTTFSWSPADFGFQAAVSYTLEIDLAQDNFANPAILAITNTTSIKIAQGKVNNALLQLNAFPGEAANVQVRVSAGIHKDVDTLYSDPVSLNITPYEQIINYPKLYVPGSYQDDWNPDWSEWDPTNEKTVIYSVKDNGVYEGYLWFSEDTTELKLLKVPAWEQDNTIGDPDTSGMSGTLQIGDWGGNNIKVPGGPGYFHFVADLNAATYTYLNTQWGVIGSSVPPYDWSEDVNMTYDKIKNVWTVTLDLVAGEIKFRANDSWDLNYGDDGGDRKLDAGGANIPIAADGNYTITLDLSGPIYTYRIVKN